MSQDELRDLLEIALRAASTVERRWIEALVARLNAASAPQKVGPAVELGTPNGHGEPQPA